MNVYDFDKTIFYKDCSTEFIKFLYFKKPYLFLKYGFKTFIAALEFFVFKVGRKEDAKEVFFEVFKHFNKEEVIKEFWDKNEKGIKPFYLKQRKDDDLIISASPTFLIEPICKRLNINYLASPINLDTLKYEGNNCYGEEKVIEYRKHFNEEIDEFYSDSLSDTPLANIAKKAYLVKGDKIEKWPRKEI